MEDFAKQFVQAFYQQFDTNKQNLVNFYQQPSQLTFQNNFCQGSEAIMQKIMSLPFQSIRHIVDDISCHQIQATQVPMVLIHVYGKLSIDGDNPMAFTETFILANNNNNWFVLNDIMKLVTG